MNDELNRTPNEEVGETPVEEIPVEETPVEEPAVEAEVIPEFDIEVLDGEEFDTDAESEPQHQAEVYRRVQMSEQKSRGRHHRIRTIVLVSVAAYLLLVAAVVGILFYLLDDARNPSMGFPEQKVEEYVEIQKTPFVPDEEANPDGTLSVKQIAKKVRPSVVGVVANVISSSPFSSSSGSVGSGIILSEDGYIITNNHVIENSDSVSVILDDGTEYGARVIGADARTDLAVLKVEAKGLPAATFGDSDALEQGDLAVAIGNPAGLQLQNTVTSGIISAINRDVIVDNQPMTLIQTDASINPGNSGGPLVNAYGQVVGINTIKIGISYYEGLGFAIPMNSVKPIVDELISRGYIKGRPTIGITGEILDERTASYFGVPAGMYVESIDPRSDAYRQGISRGDIITKVEGQNVTSLGDIQKVRDEHVAGDTITLTVYRNGETRDIKIVLMDEAEMNAVNGMQN